MKILIRKLFSSRKNIVKLFSVFKTHPKMFASYPISNIKSKLILQGISPKVCFFMPKIPVYGSLHGVSCQIYLFIRLSTIVKDPYCVCTKLSWMNPSSPQWGEFFYAGVLILIFMLKNTADCCIFVHASAFLRDRTHFNIYSTGSWQNMFSALVQKLRCLDTKVEGVS